MTDIDLSGFVPVKGFKKYLVNKKGDVYSLSRNILLKAKENSTGYLHYRLVKNTGDTSAFLYFLHRLIAIHFIPNPENYPVVRHLNDKKRDNRLENLAWGTHSDNMQDSKNNGYTSPLRTLSDKQVELVYKYQDNCRNTAKKFKTTRSIVKAIRGGFSYTGVTKDLGEPYRIKKSYEHLTKKCIKDIIKSNDSLRAIGRKYNISHGTVRKIKEGLLNE